MELAYFSGYARLREQRSAGAGVVLRFVRVRPRRSAAFQPLRSSEITPEFLDRSITALRRWNYDIVSIEETCRRAVTMPLPARFVCLTFDGASKDVITQAYPILSRHGVPFTVYLPTAFPDGVGEAWWLALEQMISRQNRISLVIDRQDRRFSTASTSEKYEAYEYFSSWLLKLPPADLALAIKDLCRRYSVDLGALSRAASMNWSDLATLAADPLVTIGGATVNYPVLFNLREADAQREIEMGKAVAETALRRRVTHFAYPFGARGTFRRAHAAMVQGAGFESAATTIAGMVESQGRTNLYALPRLSWDGRQRSLRLMRVLLSGVMFSPPENPGSS
jgi:peptidoglycan/xylan/chitin deacetylase (PgdA/CDA1 family)